MSPDSSPQLKRNVERFAPPPSQYQPDVEERAVLEFWQRERIFERSVEQRATSEPFVFFEGPPTANGKPGIHHVEARAFKDLIPRYQTMRGRRVERKAGWDTHGLPVELQVEKQLGISGKPQIENLVPGDVRASIAKFNALCKESVWQYKTEWEQFSARIGFWLDVEHPYITYDREYIESVWWILKQIWEKQLLYQDFKVVPYCPRCGTALSSHEVAQGYDETTDRSVYVKLRVVGQPTTSLVVWTTTPWTLPGNVALAIGRDISYGRYKNDDEELVLADERATAVLGPDADRLGSVSFAELTELRYEPLFAVPALASDHSYRVYPADFVTTEEGTGIVHTAVMYGEDDFALGTALDLPKHHTVDLEGKFTADVPDFAGQFVKDEAMEQQLIDYLKDGSALLREEPYRHTYPFCWRCQTPLIYYAKRSWFIRMSSLRSALLERNQTVHWVPEHLRDGRFGEWLREVKDWALSRDRYWGTPLPIWQCDRCQTRECIGSVAELTERAGQVPADLHRPFIDEVTWSCQQPSCSGTLWRQSEVIDVWFDSGSMPFAQWHYPFDPTSEERVDEGRNYPANYIAEAIDQTRGWFYSLLAVATALDRPAPYRSVISLGHVFDKAGKKMSKSRGNVVDPWVMIGEHGADAVRFYMYSVNQPDDPKKFDPADLTQVVRKTFLILWNTYGFFAQRQPDQSVGLGSPPAAEHILDRWLVARTHVLVTLVTDGLDQLDPFRASRAIADYITELSTWYLKYSRKRTNGSFLPTFGWALRTLSLAMAPFAPFFSEWLWQRLRTDDEPLSVHLADWSVVESYDTAVMADMLRVQRLVEDGLAARARTGIKIRQPLASCSFPNSAPPSELVEIIKDALNVKKLMFDSGKPLAFDAVLTDELLGEGLVRELKRVIQGLRKSAGLEPGVPARVVIAGDHPLWSQVEQHKAELQAATATTIERGAIAGEGATHVESLALSLIAE